MNAKKFYNDLKEKVKNYFGWSKQNLTKEQRDYILSGIPREILENYKIIYSPEKIYFGANNGGTKIRNLEYKLKNNSFYEKMKNIELNHLRKLNEIYSSVVETYNKGLDKLHDVLIQNKKDGSVKISFA